MTLEFYLCGEFQHIEYTRSREIWCDGCGELTIRRLHRRAFKIIGAGYFPNAMLPFEVEFHFARRRDLQPTKTIIRLGNRRHDGEIDWPKPNNTQIVARRPKYNRDWAVAVELTPIEP